MYGTGGMSDAANFNTAMSFWGGERQNKAMANQASRQIDFQEAMSNTAYQRSMADMKKAGLNPILAAGAAPASSPMGAMAAQIDTITPAISTGLQASKTTVDNELTKAKKLIADTDKILKSALEPGLKSLSVITTHVLELLEATDKILRSELPNKEEIINKLRNTIAKTFVKGNTMTQNFGAHVMSKAGKAAAKLLKEMSSSKSKSPNQRTRH